VYSRLASCDHEPWSLRRLLAFHLSVPASNKTSRYLDFSRAPPRFHPIPRACCVTYPRNVLPRDYSGSENAYATCVFLIARSGWTRTSRWDDRSRTAIDRDGFGCRYVRETVRQFQIKDRNRLLSVEDRFALAQLLSRTERLKRFAS